MGSLMPKAISPNELHRAAQAHMLEGRKPKTADDWMQCVNFWAANVSVAEVSVCKLMGKLYGCPLTEECIEEIAAFQQLKKNGK
jgi:hypothetical protein